MPKLGFSLAVALMEIHTRAQTCLSLVCELPHYTLVLHCCGPFPDCSHSSDQSNSVLEDMVLLRSLFLVLPAFRFFVLTVVSEGRLSSGLGGGRLLLHRGGALRSAQTA